MKMKFQINKISSLLSLSISTSTIPVMVMSYNKGGEGNVVVINHYAERPKDEANLKEPQEVSKSEDNRNTGKLLPNNLLTATGKPTLSTIDKAVAKNNQTRKPQERKKEIASKDISPDRIKRSTESKLLKYHKNYKNSCKSDLIKGKSSTKSKPTQGGQQGKNLRSGGGNKNIAANCPKPTTIRRTKR